MAIFTKEPTDRLEPRLSPSGNEAALSMIAAGTRIVGDIESDGVIKVEGYVEGTIRNARQVLIGRQGEVKGDVNAREVVVGGRVEGHIHAAERVEIQGTSSVVGDVHTKTIVVSEGGKLNGSVIMTEQGPGPAANGEGR
jgi:cytoskeletal protein CcmA (bactofilin family)